MYAPIVIFAYNRPVHLQKCLDSLSQNFLISKSQVFIYCDGPKTTKDENQVNAVRQVANSFTSALSTTVITAPKNRGLAASVIKGVSNIFQKHNSIIVLEDDLILHPYFLDFMNQALQKYERNKQVFSVSGHTLPEWRLALPKEYSNDVYLSPRISSWGWGTWKDRWQSVTWNLDTPAISTELQENSQTIQQLRLGGEDLPQLLNAYLKGLINSWAIRFDLTQAKQKKYTVRPVKTLVLNQGLDGSGTHGRGNWLYNDEFDLHFQPTNFATNFEVDQQVLRAFTLAHKPKLHWKLIDLGERIWRKLS